jgi:hypothetical protein
MKEEKLYGGLLFCLTHRILGYIEPTHMLLSVRVNHPFHTNSTDLVLLTSLLLPANHEHDYMYTEQNIPIITHGIF